MHAAGGVRLTAVLQSPSVERLATLSASYNPIKR